MQSDVAYKTVVCSVYLTGIFKRFVIKLKVMDLMYFQGNCCHGLKSCFTCSPALHYLIGGICGIGNKLCWLWLPAKAELLFKAAGLAAFRQPERHGAFKKNAVQDFVSSQNRQAVLALLKQLRVYDFVVCDVMRVLAFRNFTTEEAV